MRDEEQVWIMAACASLAGGKTAKEAVANADSIRDAAKSRFARQEDEE